MILLEKNRVIEEAKKRDTLKQNMEDMEVKLKTFAELSDKMGASISQENSSSATDKIKKIFDDRAVIQKQTVLLFVGITNMLDAGPFTEKTTVQDIQKQYPSIKKIAQNTIESYENDIRAAEETRDDFIAQKQKELNQITRDIEQAQFIQRNQLTDAAKKVLLYIGIFLGLMLIRYMS